MVVLEAIQLSKQHNGTAALSNLNLSVSKGEIFCLLGQNYNDQYISRLYTCYYRQSPDWRHRNKTRSYGYP
jgi:hypothetical protein